MQRLGKSSQDEHGGKWMPDRRDENLSRDEEDVHRLIDRPYQGTHRTNQDAAGTEH
jgi:hypothetical protein